MNTKITLFLAVILFMSAFYGCGKDENEPLEPIDFGYDYFPLAVGKYRVFQADSILFDTIAGKTLTDSIRFFIKEEIVDTFVNALGETVFRIERFERKKTSEPWQFHSVASAERNKTKAIKTEQNFRLIKMVFPINSKQFWNPTLYIDETVEVKVGKKEIELFKSWDSEVKAIGEEISILNRKFSSVLTISQADDESKIELRRVTEKYAKGIGLISNEMEILDTQSILNETNWRKKAQKGFILKQYLIDYN
jgi:hypothetical protein